MKKSLLLFTILGLAASAAPARANSVGLELSSLASLVFDAATDSFTFNSFNTPGQNFWVVEQTVNGSTTFFNIDNALRGLIEGTFAIGTPTPEFPSGSESQTAPVTGMGSFTIYDGAGFNFTAALAFKTLTVTPSNPGHSHGEINSITGLINLTDFSYAGTNAFLLALLETGGANLNLGFSLQQAGTIPNISYLLENGATTSFDGQLQSCVVPVPAGWALLMVGGSLTGVVGLRRRKAVATV